LAKGEESRRLADGHQRRGSPALRRIL